MYLFEPKEYLIKTMIFKFYNRNDKNQETIGRVVTTSRLQAAKLFAERKQLPLKEFLKVFGVTTII
jgi:hypothetical protein